MSKYRFYITHNSITTEVNPLYSGIKFKWKKDGYRFSKECSTEFTFREDDFSVIYSIEIGELRCEAITFEIQKSCDKGVTYSTHWTGEFSLNDGEFNIDRCTFKTKMSVVDKYTCLNSKKGKKINVLNTERINISGQHQEIPSDIQFYICVEGDCDPVSVARGTLVYTDNYRVDGTAGNVIQPFLVYANEFITINKIDGVAYPPSSDVAWELISETSTQASYSRPYVGGTMSIAIKQPPGVSAGYFFNCAPQYPVPDTIAGYSSYIPITYGLKFYGYEYPFNGIYYPDAGWNIQYQCQNLYYALPLSSYNTFHYLYDCIVYILNQICPDITGVVSDFFEWNPVGDAPGYVAGKNYVTLDGNKVNRLAISQKSDVRTYHPDQYATIGEISFDELISDLINTFNLDWFIDSSGNFRIEHVSYFTSVLGYNSTTSPHDEFNNSNQVYNYAKEKMPNREQFSFMEAQGNDFKGKDITYSGACIQSDDNSDGAGSKQYIVKNFTTDLNYIENYPNQISNKGFVMVACDESNNVINEIGLITGYITNNAHLSWANLHYNYWRHGRVLLEGNMNGALTSFFTAIENKIQKNVKLKICCGEEFDPTGKLIQTELGIGSVDSAEEENGIITMKLSM